MGWRRGRHFWKGEWSGNAKGDRMKREMVARRRKWRNRRRMGGYRRNKGRMEGGKIGGGGSG